MKKQLIIFTIFCILLAGIVLAVPALENIYGVKNFVDGLQSNGATVATLDANSKVPLANSYTPDLSGYVPYDVNSHVADSAIYDKHTNLDANSLTLTNASIDPNGTASFKACKINNLDAATLDANSKVPVANNYNSDTKNWVMNGNMEVAQRGTSFTNPASGTYTLDRWKLQYDFHGGTPPNIIHSQQQLTPGELDKSKYFYRVNVDGSGSSFGDATYYPLLTCIEHGLQKLAGVNKKVTLSFMARSSIANKKIGTLLYNSYGTGGSPSANEAINGNNWTLTSNWTLYSHTFTLADLSGKTFGTNNDYIGLQFYLAWGSVRAYRVNAETAETFVGAGNIDIAQVALYAGDVAYPFEPKPYSQELFDCQYYCQVYDSTDDTFKVNIITDYDIHFKKQLLRPMRIKPFCTFLGTENTDYLVTDLIGNPQSGFTFNINSYTSQKSLYVIASKVSHGLTDARFMFSATGKIIADADF
jgi:hypothetical protein